VLKQVFNDYCVVSCRPHILQKVCPQPDSSSAPFAARDRVLEREARTQGTSRESVSISVFSEGKEQKSTPVPPEPGPVREDARQEVLAQIKSKGITRAVVFDLETNGLSQSYSVLSCAAVKVDIETPMRGEVELLPAYATG
jgi:hypothetical protein